MAYEMAETLKYYPRIFACGATSLAAKQFYNVHFHTDGTVELADTELDFLGVLYDTPGVGDLCDIVASGFCRGTIGAATALGDGLDAAGDGMWDPAADGGFARARAMMAGGTAADNIMIQLYEQAYPVTAANMTTWYANL